MKKSLNELKELAKICRGDIIKMTTVAKSGHPGGSMSSIDMYLSVFNLANIDPKNPYDYKRDRVVISHGHTSPGVYSALSRLGFLNPDEVIAGFRHSGSIFEGHITRGIPGIEWTTGNLGQGLSAGVGMALASKITGNNYHVFVLHSDGEAPKGQIAEARRTAKKENLNNLTVLVDYNDIQISGRARDVLYVDLFKEYESAGWNIIEVDGHDFEQLFNAIEEAKNYKLGPTVIIAKTIIGKGVSFMENRHEYHGAPLNDVEADKALKELGVENDIEKYKEMRKTLPLLRKKLEFDDYVITADAGTPITYTKEDKVDNRGAFGNAIADLAKINKGKIVAVDCDLKPSVKLGKFEKVSPETYVQIGIQEHNAATIAGAMSVCGVIPFFADFGVFGLDETFNQQRLNDINHTNLKTAVTHCGIDIGEDGKTHHEINYIGIVRSFFDTKLIVPADPNQTDRAVRYAASTLGNVVIAMGRSKIPVILDENGNPYFGETYEFEYGKMDILRKGEKLTILTHGSVAYKAVKVADKLKKEGINISVINVSAPLEFDASKISEYIDNSHIIIYEDHNKYNGLMVEFSKSVVENRLSPLSVENLGIDNYSPSGNNENLFKIFGLDEDSLYEKIKEKINK
ncbi:MULTISPECIES: transketolase [unclassified Marinitoga]|uniref:transketolase n=1 Tax=unclassified Marinitoga TaxID=2640159 RepID=UPI000640BBE8|nr:MULTISPECIES: transketolase [unclassified Marinitoga]KLO24534.1 transketolase [Marinitoga sp. 1155]NUU99415.1 transketolase [Marinitoga sp. 1154]